MERLIVIVTVLLMFACPVFARDWIVQVSGNDDVFGLGVFMQPTEKVQVGVEAKYFDMLKASQSAEYSLQAVAKYYGLQQAELDLKVFKVDVDWYVGLGLGVRLVEDTRPDDIADVRTGFVFGDGPVRLGIEYEYIIPSLAWDGFENAEHKVLGTIQFMLK